MSTQSIDVSTESAAGAPAAEGRLRDAFVLLKANKVALLGLVLTTLFLLIGMAGAVVLLHPSLHHLWEDQDLAAVLLSPGADGHLLDTDNFGRDLFWRVVAATGLSVLMATGITAFVIILGLVLGSIAGFFGGKTETGIIGLIDLTWGFPLLLVAVIFAGMVGKGLWALAGAAAVVLWAGFARIIRAQVKTLREREFVEAARMLGTPSYKILVRHMWPNVLGTVFVMSSYYIAYTIIVEAGFSFIGLGVRPPTPSLGGIVAEGRNFWTVSIWPSVIPGVTIALIVLGLNSLGDGLRDIFDPRLRRF